METDQGKSIVIAYCKDNGANRKRSSHPGVYVNSDIPISREQHSSPTCHSPKQTRSPNQNSVEKTGPHLSFSTCRPSAFLQNLPSPQTDCHKPGTFFPATPATSGATRTTLYVSSHYPQITLGTNRGSWRNQGERMWIHEDSG